MNLSIIKNMNINQCMAIKRNSSRCKIFKNIQKVYYKNEIIYLCKRHINVFNNNINNLKIYQNKKVSNNNTILKYLTRLSLENQSNINTLIEKYKPKDLTNFCGNKDNVQIFIKWLLNWNFNIKYKCILISGPCGVGKTLCANLICNSMNYNIINNHNEHLIKIINDNNFINNSIYKEKKILIIDEFDNYDKKELKKLLKMKILDKIKIPIIFICNDIEHVQPIKKFCYNIYFEKPSTEEIFSFVKNICIEENIKVSCDNLIKLILYKKNDIRAIINDLSFYIDNINNNIIEKDVTLTTFDCYKKLINDKFLNLTEKNNLTLQHEHDFLRLMVHKNYLYINKKLDKCYQIEQIHKISDLLSYSDTINCIDINNNLDIISYKNIVGIIYPCHFLKKIVVER